MIIAAVTFAEDLPSLSHIGSNNFNIRLQFKTIYSCVTLGKVGGKIMCDTVTESMHMFSCLRVRH